MAMLRLIKESEIRRGNIIGSGAFGTVYKARIAYTQNFDLTIGLLSVVHQKLFIMRSFTPCNEWYCVVLIDLYSASSCLIVSAFLVVRIAMCFNCIALASSSIERCG